MRVSSRWFGLVGWLGVVALTSTCGSVSHTSSPRFPHRQASARPSTVLPGPAAPDSPGSPGLSSPGPLQELRAEIDATELTVDRVREAYAAGELDAVSLTRAFLARIQRFEERYNAFISMNPGALKEAEVLDEEYRVTGPRGPLHGVPVVIKDNIDYGGLVTTAGFRGFSSATGGVDMIPDDDAAVVERLREAGAIILGKTNLPDFAGHGTRTTSTVAGTTLNPYDVTRIPGGSSGGTATAVNASFAVLGLGTETGGSIQNPASAQGLVGVKPTFGLVPLEGIVPMSATWVDVVGPLARTVRDAAYVMDVIAGPSDEDPRTEAASGHIPESGFVGGLSERALEGKRFGLVGEGWRTSFLPLAPETETRYREAISLLQAQGAQVVEDPFRGSGFIEKYRDRRDVRSGGGDEMAEYLEGLGEGAPFNSIPEWEELSGESFRRGRWDRFQPSPDSADARTRPDSARVPSRPRDREAGLRPSAEGEGPNYGDWRREILDLFRRVLAEHDLDGLFFPQAGAPIGNLVEDPTRPDYSPNNHPELPSNIVNDLGIPVVTVPFGLYEDGTPFVLAFIGDAWTERELLAYAYDLEQAAEGRIPPTLTEGPPR